jgi:arylsulfatase A-like enzyme
MKRVWAFGLLLAICNFAGCRRPSVKDSSPNIILVVIDALRADRLNDYGHDRKTNPFLAEFGKRGIRFTNAYSQSSHTKLSVASLLTGLIPPHHGVRQADFPWEEEKTRYFSDSLSSKLTTLAEVLQKKGYRTAGFVTNPHLKSYFGFSQGFEDYTYIDLPQGKARPLNNEIVRWLKQREKNPFFIYVHYMDIHAPYRPSPEYRSLYTRKKDLVAYGSNGPHQGTVDREAVQYTKDCYDAKINYWDDCFRELIRQMEEQGWAGNTIFVILSDHGEEFYDHGGFGHGFTLYQEQLRVPLYIVGQGRIPPGQVRKDRVEVIDIFPTLCALAGQKVKSLGLQGKDLLASEGLSPDSFHYAETCMGKAPVSVQTADFKLIYNVAEKSFELYDLKNDRKESANIISSKPAWARAGQKELLELMASRKPGIQSSKREMSRETMDALRSLGYIR